MLWVYDILYVVEYLGRIYHLAAIVGCCMLLHAWQLLLELTQQEASC